MNTDNLANGQLTAQVALHVRGYRVSSSSKANERDLYASLPRGCMINHLANKRMRNVEISSPHQLLLETEIFVFVEGQNWPLYHDAPQLKYHKREGSQWIYRSPLAPVFWREYAMGDGECFHMSILNILISYFQRSKNTASSSTL